MTDFNRHTFPAGGGWTFRQPQTGWVNPMAMVGFDASVKAIVAHRKANPAITSKHKLSTDPFTVASELERYTKLRLGIPEPAPPSFFWKSSSHLPARVVAAAVEIKKAAEGAAVPIDWFKSGGMPVNKELAEKRAAICVACPKNVAGNWFIESAAEIVKEVIELRGDIKLETSHDADLKSCDVCTCLMRLKCHTPLQFILKNTKAEVLEQFPNNCWIHKRDQ